ncbi:hypothetical protein [Salinimicrobium soli]|uniref:hypothetical protein n=1 Tax=Salinimicrobium soli TaxID=1254399 RepID=UPI003AAEE835
MKNAQKLLIIKLLHTVVWAFFVAIIFYVVYSGVVNEITPFTWVAIGLVLAEGLVLLIFKMFCPLTLIARKYSASEKDNFDIFLPNWVARHNKVIFTSIFLVGVVLVLLRVFIK